MQIDFLGACLHCELCRDGPLRGAVPGVGGVGEEGDEGDVVGDGHQGQGDANVGNADLLRKVKVTERM